jgi:hypothetical protein
MQSLFAQGDWRDAENYWRQLKQKDAETHKALYRQVLRQKLGDPSVLLTEKTAAEVKLKQLGGDDPRLADEVAPLIEGRTSPSDDARM